jgi:OmpA-OmpF porin, OOP family
MKPTACLQRGSFPIGLALLLSASAAGAGGEAAVQQVTVRSVAYFGFDQASLRPADQAAMLAEVAKLKDVTWQSVTATGHTDSVGSADYNEKLSDRRAESVKGYLVGKGLDPQMIQTAAKAATAPAAPNESPGGRAKNRRAEIEFQGVRASRE